MFKQERFSPNKFSMIKSLADWYSAHARRSFIPELLLKGGIWGTVCEGPEVSFTCLLSTYCKIFLSTFRYSRDRYTVVMWCKRKGMKENFMKHASFVTRSEIKRVRERKMTPELGYISRLIVKYVLWGIFYDVHTGWIFYNVCFG